jgi:UDP-GlcNAc3NAcA epimerase
MPEEINRVLTDHLSEILFAPTEAAVTNLRREGLPEDRLRLVGDVMYDAALHFRSLAATRSGILGSLGLTPKQFVLATVHRAENTDDRGRLEIIVQGLAAAAARMPVVWPVHPRTRGVLDRLSIGALERIKMIAPVGYLDMVALESAAAVIATDSGGVQKEAFFHKVPCVTLRDETEWTELIELGWNRLTPPTDAARIATSIHDAAMLTGATADPYGGGQASVRIARHLHERWA